MTVIVDMQGQPWRSGRDRLVWAIEELWGRGLAARPELLRSGYGFTFPYLTRNLAAALQEAQQRRRARTRAASVLDHQPRHAGQPLALRLALRRYAFRGLFRILVLVAAVIGTAAAVAVLAFLFAGLAGW